ncbi:MAG TPA: zinc ribbon domain-containing protein [Ktedonobacteraceae bacterium]|nr:zinc ribbon domain-containing protein [Ktedonobacteraceae bacterium]
MSDFVESAKNIVSSAVSRTSWQAQKQLRVRAKQSEIDQLLEQRTKLLDELAKIARGLYQQGRLSDAQLSRLCASIQELDHDVQNREQQLLEVKSEQYNVAQFAPSTTANYAPPPVSQTPPPAAPASSAAPGSARAGKVCPNCGSPVRPNALYCRTCGAKLR